MELLVQNKNGKLRFYKGVATVEKIKPSVLLSQMLILYTSCKSYPLINRYFFNRTVTSMLV